ncbi:transposase [Modicisalibacter xianhensis]|uniref:transposase n=1 Tax=Modicisalibacter xianhensis TaxID=442341 RepID=UPI003BF4C72C
MTTKIHLVCDTHGVSLSFLLKPGQHAASRCISFLEQIRLSGPTGRPHKRCRHLLTSRGYDSARLPQYYDRYGTRPTIRHRQMPSRPKPVQPDLLERSHYRRRNVIERLFGWISIIQ